MKYILLIFLSLSLIVGLYCAFSAALKVPPWKASLAYKRPVQKKSAGIISGCTKWLSRHIPVNKFRSEEIRKGLAAAGIAETPKEYLASAILPAAAALLTAVPAYFLNPLLAVIPAAFAVYLFLHRYNTMNRVSSSRKTAIEKELPRFVAYMANELKSNRNVLGLIDAYKANYDSPLTEELSITVADMRTGNQEQALQHLESRVNSPLLSELVRGLLSALRGDDMTLYFNNLSYKLSDVWRERLKQQALKKEPKIDMMSFLLFVCSIITVFIVLGVAVYSSAALMGG